MDEAMGATAEMKWACIGWEMEPARYRLLETFLNSKGLSNRLDLIEVSVSEFADRLPEMLAQYDQIRVESPHRQSAFHAFKHHEVIMSQLKAADCIFKDHQSHWWCRSLTYYSLCEALQKFGEKLDLESSVLIVGAGSSARSAVASGAKMGFKSFKVTNKFDDQGLEMIRDMKKNFFGLDFEFVPQDKLILLPGTNALAVNTTPFRPSNDLLEELYYFNFLKRNGIIVDLTVSPLYTPLLKQAEEIQNDIVFGHEIAAYSDALWIEWVFDHKIAVQELKSYYRDHLEQEEKASTKEENLTKN